MVFSTVCCVLNCTAGYEWFSSFSTILRCAAGRDPECNLGFMGADKQGRRVCVPYKDGKGGRKLV